ncbi:MAG: J domain-containing protein [Chthoniobacterales bacterium]
MPVEFRDYYETLGVPKTATGDEIKSAFRKLARKFHPDMAKDKKAAEEKFKGINEAYEVLGDPEKRKKYDSYGANWEQAGQRPPPGWGQQAGGGGGYPGGIGGDGGEEFHFGGTGFSDFFEQLFGARRTGGMDGGGFPGGGGFGGAAQGPSRGQDVEADIVATLEEALHGSTRQVSFRRSTSNKVETYTVKIPKGVREGQRIRLAGQGGAGGKGGPAGDLYLKVKFQKHPDYEVEGSDIIYDMEIPVAQVVLGTEMEVPTLDGRARLRIPAGTQNGKKFRMVNRGLPEKGGTRGDYYAVVNVVIPEKITPKQKELWEQLAKEISPAE